MAKLYGSLSLFDQGQLSQTVVNFGEQRAFEILSANLAAHNRAVDEMIAEFADVTTDQQRNFGSGVTGEMVDADEYAAPEAQKRQVSSTAVGFPLRQKQYGLQWTNLWMQTHTVADLEKEYVAGRTADIKAIHQAVRQALFTPTNNTAYIDRRVDNLPYTIRALLNGDGQAIPLGPNLEVFPGSHTHYLTSGQTYVTAAQATALINTVVEHGHTGGGQVRVYINRADEGDKDTANSGWRALPGFAPYTDTRLIQPDNAAAYARGDLSFVNLYNRAIGIYQGAEIWVKPWVPQGYAFAFDRLTPQKPLGFRVRAGTTLGQLQIVAEWADHYPLRAQAMAREFGIGVWTRSNGAVLQNTAGAYTAPTINQAGI